MKKINSLLIADKIADLRKRDVLNFQTNYFMTPLNSEVFYWENEGAVVFLQPEFYFFRLYFAYTHLDGLESIFQTLPPLEIYLEIITKTEPNFLGEILTRYFSFETVYQKMFKKLELKNEKKCPQSEVDLDEIFKNIYSTFNIYYDHLMNKDELSDLNENGGIITVKENGELKSFLIFKIKGKSAYLNHIANYGNKENLIHLWEKFYKLLNYKNVNYLDLWCDTKNAKALNMYKIEEFKPFPLKNYIYKFSR